MEVPNLIHPDQRRINIQIELLDASYLNKKHVGTMNQINSFFLVPLKNVWVKVFSYSFVSKHKIKKNNKEIWVPKGHNNYAHDWLSPLKYDGKMIHRISSKTMWCIFWGYNEQMKQSKRIFSSLDWHYRTYIINWVSNTLVYAHYLLLYCCQTWHIIKRQYRQGHNLQTFGYPIQHILNIISLVKMLFTRSPCN